MASNQVATTLTIAYWIASVPFGEPGQIFSAMDLDRLGISGSILRENLFVHSMRRDEKGVVRTIRDIDSFSPRRLEQLKFTGD